MTEAEKIERVRAAILRAFGDKVLLDEDGETLIDGYVDASAAARAAIEAMRETDLPVIPQKQAESP